MVQRVDQYHRQFGLQDAGRGISTGTWTCPVSVLLCGLEPAIAGSPLRFEGLVVAGHRSPPRTQCWYAEAIMWDVVADVTGSVEFRLQVALEAIKHGKNLVMVNAGLNATLGPRWARR